MLQRRGFGLILLELCGGEGEFASSIRAPPQTCFSLGSLHGSFSFYAHGQSSLLNLQRHGPAKTLCETLRDTLCVYKYFLDKAGVSLILFVGLLMIVL
jgi:hypothetical protein